MLLYITRKNAPSIGGMQRFNQKLIAHLSRTREFRLISWGHSQAMLPLFLVYAFCKAVFLRITGRIDLIYLSDGLMSPMGWLLKKLLSVPVAVNIHGRDIAFAFPGYLTIVPAALRHLDRVICVSKQLKEICRGYGIPEEIIRVIPNGVNVEDFTWSEKSPPLRRVGIEPEGRTVMITVGRLVPKKGVDRFVEKILPAIVKKNARVLYLVAGDGPLRESIEMTIKEKGLEDYVKLMGNVPMDDGSLKALYCGSDIFVMPNVDVPGDIEGFGIVAIEGGVSGLAVVASRLQGIQEAVTPGENGLLIEWNDDRAFIDTLIDLIENPEQRRAMGEKARRYVIEHYSWDKIATLYSEVFSELTGSRGSR